MIIESVALDRWRGDYPDALGVLGGEIIGNAADGMGLSLLIARPGALAQGAIADALRKAGARDLKITEVGAARRSRFLMRRLRR